VLTQFKNTPLVMKGEVKPIEPNATINNDKKFLPIISQTKLYPDKGTKVLRQIRDNNLENSMTKQEKIKATTPDTVQKFHAGIDLDKQSTKSNFENFDEKLENEVSYKFAEDYSKLVIENKFVYDLFKSIDLLSLECIDFVFNEIIKLVEDHYNIINDQHANDFIYFFLIAFDSYLIFDTEDPKFIMIHRNLVTFFKKSFKNVSEDLVFIYKNIFFNKFFEALKNNEYKDKVDYICELIYRIIDPTENQLKDFFKLFKDNITNEEVLYKAFAELHDLIPVLPEHIIDTCLFYVLKGVNSFIIDIRYYSLYILYKYMLMNVNFYYNFESKLF
jgi:hypothetical protein